MQSEEPHFFPRSHEVSYRSVDMKHVSNEIKFSRYHVQVSCASSKTYKDHIEGQRHKKRVALREQEKKNDELATVPSTGASYKCVLCDVTCTGKETFDAHITGSVLTL